MSSWAGRARKRARVYLSRDLRRAEYLLSIGKVEKVKGYLDLWKNAALDLGLMDYWKRVSAQCIEQEKSGCPCWACVFSEEEKARVNELANQKEAQLSAGYVSNSDNNFLGAFAEAVFGVRYGLEINLIAGRDGGVDYRLPSGLLTVDVKGSDYNELRLPKRFINRPDHIYVLIQVADGKHAFFRGFAFGSDDFCEHLEGYFEALELRGLDELEKLLSWTIDPLPF